MNAACGLALDAATLFIGTAWLLSAAAAVLPLPAAPADRSREAFRLAVLPALGALAVLAAAFWPSVRAGATGAPDHCGLGPAGHPQLCWQHAVAGPTTSHDLLAAGLAAIFLAAVAWRLGGWAIATRRLRALASVNDETRAATLAAGLAAAGAGFPGEVWVVRAERPWCFVTGLRRPRLLVATAVLDGLPPPALGVVAAHEAAHVRRGDPASRYLVTLASLVHLPGLGRHAARRWSAAAELACDEAAASAAGSRLVVAETLVSYQRLVNGALRQPGLAFGGDAPLADRVAAMLAPAAVAGRWPAAWPWGALGLVLWQAERLHDGLEAVLRAFHG